MEKKLLRLLEENRDSYLLAHPKTGEADLHIAKSIWQGRGAVQVSLEIPCSESTVYRGLRRVKDFLVNNQSYFDVLSKFVMDHPPDFGDGNAHSILEMLFIHYEEFNNFESEVIQEEFDRLYRELEEITFPKTDQIIHTVCSLCREYERAGFIEGVKVGVRMGIDFYS